MKIKKVVANWLTPILFPVAMIFIGILFMLTPVFLIIEYRMPGFPDDSYGFSLKDRLKWAGLAQQYLVNDSGVEFLANLKFSDGSDLYNERELSHMKDVKRIIKPVLWFGFVSWILLVGFSIFSYRGKKKWEKGFLLALRKGGYLTIILIIIIGVLAASNFWDFFTVFHGLFFVGDSWLFYYSDTLIRLFPLRFWQDVFIMVGVIAIVGSLFSICGIKKKCMIVDD